MRVIQGDLIALALEGRFDVIVHGCNCFCSMEAGIATLIKAAFPEAYEADCATIPGDLTKLGTISHATTASGLIIVNGYTQFHYTGRGVLVDYEAVRGVMQAVRNRFHGRRIGYPKIGAGLARGDWNTISVIISEELSGEDHTLVECISQTTL